MTAPRDCACGCGQPVTRNRKAIDGWNTFVHNHHIRGAGNPRYRSGLYTDKSGYVYVRVPEHPRANPNGYVRRAIVVAELAASRPLAADEHVHHINRVVNDDRPENLVILDAADHMRLHGDILSTERLGTANPAAKLTETDVLTIYNAAETTTALAARFGVCRRTIRNIRNGSNWRHLTTGAASC